MGEDNVFVRFKKYVDANIAAGLDTMLGLPSPPSRPQPHDQHQNQSHSQRTAMGNVYPTSGSSCPRDRPSSPVYPGHIARDCSWQSILAGTSPYAPSSLRHLPALTPSDLPPHLRDSPSIFTFEDAFEDLLTVSKGEPLPDITFRHRQRRLLNQVYPRGEPHVSWLARLHSQGLVTDSDRAESRVLEGLSENWTRLREELGLHSDVWEDLARMEQLANTLWQMPWNGQTDRDQPPESDARGSVAANEKRPDTEADLFTAIEEAAASANRSWNVFLDQISQAARIDDTPEKALPAQATPAPSRADQAQPAAHVHEPTRQTSEQHRTTREAYVDDHGFLHTHISERILDKDGRELGTRTEVVVRPATPDEVAAQGTAGRDDTKGPPPYGSAGWFWR